VTLDDAANRFTTYDWSEAAVETSVGGACSVSP
jgi:hypothetical protein